MDVRPNANVVFLLALCRFLLYGCRYVFIICLQRALGEKLNIVSKIYVILFYTCSYSFFFASSAVIFVIILFFFVPIIELQAYAKMWADSYNAQKPPKRVDFVQVPSHDNTHLHMHKNIHTFIHQSSAQHTLPLFKWLVCKLSLKRAKHVVPFVFLIKRERVYTILHTLISWLFRRGWLSLLSVRIRPSLVWSRLYVESTRR